MKLPQIDQRPPRLACFNLQKHDEQYDARHHRDDPHMLPDALCAEQYHRDCGRQQHEPETGQRHVDDAASSCASSEPSTATVVILQTSGPSRSRCAALKTALRDALDRNEPMRKHP
ncbi:hypothetical protein OH764_20840 [Burkholderia sp. M6-3]